jgi:CTP synthase (UTP-ammonia lyase)
VTKDGEIMQTNSLHHQMMYPYDINHELLAWSYPKHSKVYLDGTNDEIVTMHDKEEPEIVYFPGINGLAIQGHPEYPSAPMKFHDYCVSLAKRYFNLKEVK